MNRTILRTGFIALLMGLTGLVHAAPKVVAITQIVEHPALDAVYKGVKDELTEEGFAEGTDVT